jgi:hypothetical protein
MPLVATTQTFVNRENVKEIITQPQVYENIVDMLASSVTMMDGIDSTEGLGDIVGLLEEGSEFSENVEIIITSDETKEKLNTVIDAFYDWFEGKTDSPEFEVYLIEDEEVFKELFSSVLLLKLKTLPDCENYSYENIENNILELECLPPYVDVDEIEPLIEDSLNEADMEEVMSSIKLSSDQLYISYDNTVLVQSIYTILKFLPFILIGIVLLLTVLIFLLIPGFKGGLITTSVIYLLIGIFYLLLSTVGKMNKIITSLINSAPVDIGYVQIQKIVNTLLSPIIDRIIKNLTLYSLITIGVGVLLLVLGIVLKKKTKVIKKDKD